MSAEISTGIWCERISSCLKCLCFFSRTIAILTNLINGPWTHVYSSDLLPVLFSQLQLSLKIPFLPSVKSSLLPPLKILRYRICLQFLPSLQFVPRGEIIFNSPNHDKQLVDFTEESSHIYQQSLQIALSFEDVGLIIFLFTMIGFFYPLL